MTVIANRLDGIVREMTNTLLRAARSAVISSARDFSCCILTGDNQLLASAEGLPVHIFGAHLQGENMSQISRGRHPRGRCLSRQRSLWRQYPSGRPHVSGAGVHRRRASVHDGRQMSHGRHRQQHSVELFRQGARRLRGRRAGFSGRAHPARLQERARRHPHVPCAHPRAGSMVWRRARGARLRTDRRAAAQGAVPEIRIEDDQDLHQGLVRLFGAARGRVRSASCRRRRSPIPASPIRSKASCPKAWCSR